MNMQLLGAVLLALLSGLAGAVITQMWHDSRENVQIKRDVLRRVAGTRYLLTQPGLVLRSGEPFVALNEAFIVFAEDPEVMAALEALRTGRDRSAENVVALIKRMAAAANVPVNLDDAFIIEPFTPKSKS